MLAVIRHLEGSITSHTKSIHYYKCSLNDRLAILLYHFVVGIKSTYVKTGGRVASASSPLDVNCTRSGNNVPPTPSSWRVLGVVCENAVTAAVICECHSSNKERIRELSFDREGRLILVLRKLQIRYKLNLTSHPGLNRGRPENLQ